MQNKIPARNIAIMFQHPRNENIIRALSILGITDEVNYQMNIYSKKAIFENWSLMDNFAKDVDRFLKQGDKRRGRLH